MTVQTLLQVYTVNYNTRVFCFSSSFLLFYILQEWKSKQRFNADAVHPKIVDIGLDLLELLKLVSVFFGANKQNKSCV